MKRKIGLVVATLFATTIALIPLLRDQTWACGVVMSRQGRGTPYQEGRSTTFGPVGGETRTFGALVTSSGMRFGESASSRGPVTIYMINFYGSNEFKFRYTGDVTSIALWSGDQKVYDGPPIGSYRADKKQGLGVHFEWSGNEASVEIADRCSLRSVWSGLF